MARGTRWGLAALVGIASACGPGSHPTQDVTIAVSPSEVALLPGTSQQFTASVSGLPDGSVTWSVAEGDAGGSIDADGNYTAPQATGTYHVVATSRAETSHTAQATVKVTTAPAISIDPTSATLDPGATQRFTATVIGMPDTSVDWSVAEGDAGGSVDGHGTYSAPAAAGTYHVVAASHAVPSLTASAEVTVRPPKAVRVAIEPTSADVAAGGSVQFAATVSGTTDARVTWSVREGATGGTVDAKGAYVAPSTAGTYHVVVASVADPTASAAATVTVHAPTATVAIRPATANVVPGAQLYFSATVNGVADSSAVIFSVAEGDAGGSIDAAGVYHPPQATGTFHVVATSRVAPDASARATVTVLPPNDVWDRGGPVLPDAHVYAIWWGDRAAFGDAIPAVEALFRGTSGTRWLGTLDQYLRGANASVTFEGHLYDPTTPVWGQWDAEVCGALDAAGLAPDPSAIYFVYLVVPSLSKYAFVGSHFTSLEPCHGTKVAIAVQLSDGHAFPACPGGLSDVAQWLAMVTTHELAEAMTDPQNSLGWADVVGAEVADKCATFTCGAFGGTLFPAAQLWSNASGFCVGP